FGAQLEQFIGAVLEHFDSHKAFLAIVLESEHLREQELSGPRTSRPNTALLEIYRRVEELLMRGRIGGMLRPEGAEMFPSFLMGLLKGTLSRELSAPPGVPLVSCPPAFVPFLRHGP